MPGMSIFFGGVLLLVFCVVIGGIAGLLFGLLSVPIWHRLRKTPKEQRRPRWLVRIAIALASWVAVSAVTFVVLMIWWAVDSLRVSNNYWEYSGQFDYWRMPLEPPYELQMIDTLDTADIGAWRTNISVNIHFITKYVKKDHIMLGECAAGFLDTNDAAASWFFFDCKTGQKEIFQSEEEFQRASERVGLGPNPKLLTIQENWNLYWANPRKE